MKTLEKLGKVLNSVEQKTINGGTIGCNIFLCTPESEGCPCYGNPNSPDGRGCCMDGMCID